MERSRRFGVTACHLRLGRREPVPLRAAITVKVHQSLANCSESYQCCPSRQIPLENGKPVTMPRDFDHTDSKLRWSPYFNNGFRKKQSHHPGFFSSV
jgi:hypothetical protein